MLVDLGDLGLTVDRILCDAADCVGDVLPSAIGYGHVEETVVVILGTLHSVIHGLQNVVRQEVHVTDDLDADVFLMHTPVIGEIVEGFLEEVHEVIDLGLFPVEVLGGERVDG